jgi:hypothetical protein
MRGTVRPVALLAAIATTWLIVACATSPVDVAFDRREDFSRFRTWDWIDGAALVVHAPFQDTPVIEARLAARIERELRARGLERAPGRAELRVAVLLVAQRSYQAFRRATAVQTLNSFHHSGSYEVQSEVTERRPIDRFRLAVYITGSGQERLIWQAELDERYLDGFARHLDDAVANLLERFPPRSAY